MEYKGHTELGSRPHNYLGLSDTSKYEYKAEYFVCVVDFFALFVN